MTTPALADCRSPLAATLFAALLLAGSGCIERPWGDGVPATSSGAPAPSAMPRANFDRNSVRDALVSQLPPDATPVGAVFGESAELVAFRSEPPALVPGQRARITLYWRCRKPMSAWHIFVHLDDATGATQERIHAEHDPVQGRFPTDAWHPGDLIADAFTITVDKNPLALFVGFFAEGESRLQLDTPGKGRDDGSNRLFVGNIPLVH